MIAVMLPGRPLAEAGLKASSRGAQGTADRPMQERLDSLTEKLLAPVPTPAGMTSREIVRRAIEFAGPPRVPYSFLSPLQTDFFFEATVLSVVRGGRGGRPSGAELGEVYHDAWGIGWEVTKRHWDHAIDHPLKDLSALDQYRFPDVAALERFSWLAPYLERAREAGKYVVGWDPIGMYEQMRSLMGFEDLMVAPYTQPDGLAALLDRLTDLTIEIIDHFARMGGVDGFMTWQDFGLQTTLQMNVETFREFYKPRFARTVEAAHDRGMHYIFHNCGQILDMLPDMIEIGVDVVQLDQPRLMGYRHLADSFGGRICFWNTVDIQWSTGEAATEAGIHAEVKEMMRAFDRFDGGIIARHYPQPWDIALPPEFHSASYEAFLENGCGLA
jgi:hypothetical protein